MANHSTKSRPNLYQSRAQLKRIPLISFALLFVTGVLGCRHPQLPPDQKVTRTSALFAVDLSVPTHPEFIPDQVVLSTARNSWTQLVLQLDCSQLPAHPMLRLPRFASAPGKFATGVAMSVCQILPVPVDMNDADYVRQTGESGRNRTVPRVLFPLPISDGLVDLSASLWNGSSASKPTASQGHAAPGVGQVLLYIDLHISSKTIADHYVGTCELVDGLSTTGGTGNATTGTAAASVPVKLTVEDLTLPAERHLHFAAPLNWNSLVALHPAQFEALTPRLLSRQDNRLSGMLKTLDDYMQLAHENKADFYIPRLQPVVKWPLGKMPDVDWADFDSMVYPWLTGKVFPDLTPVGFWPMPAPDTLINYDLSSRIQYFHQAAQHFDQMQWLDRSPVVLSNAAEYPPDHTTELSAPSITEPVTEADSILLSAEARQILTAHPRVLALLPMQDDQTQLVSTSNPSGINLESTSRLMTATPGLVAASPSREWPAAALPPRHWVDATAGNGSVQVTGLASEQGVRTLAWLAFARDASLVVCGSPLPSREISVPAKQLIWCYPGDRFGVDHPLATLQLKWIRQAEQDYEYLLLASQQANPATAMGSLQTNSRSNVLRMCRLITKPVQLQPGQAAQPLFNLLAGSTDPRASEEARQLLVSRYLSPASSPAASTSGAATKLLETDSIALQTLRWFTTRQRPTLVATGVHWTWNSGADASINTDPGTWIGASIDVAIYNPADEMATGNQLAWTNAQGGWQIHPQPVEIPPLAQYQVGSFSTSARFNLNKVSADSRLPVQLNFIDGFTGQSVPCKIALPVATSERREQPVNLDGSLSDWVAGDAIQLDQPLVKMLNRPAMQSQDLQLVDPPASVYTSWSDDNFYVAFRLGGVSTGELQTTRNFVQYDHGRAWGEDLCEVLIQPVYIDNTVGPTLHIVAKPGGNWVEQQLHPDDTWQPFEASGIRYAAGVEAPQKIWRGELAIPWKAIAAPGHRRPGLLRFNFIQHQHSTAQSASWAGPIDQSRDAKMSGLLLLKEP